MSETSLWRKIASHLPVIQRRRRVRVAHIVEVYDEPITVYPQRPKKKLFRRVRTPTKVVGRIGTIDQSMDLLRLGWKPVSDGYVGYVHYKGKAIKARLKLRYGREFHIYLHKPDKEIFNKHDLQCLNYSGRGWYYVHMLKGKEGNGNPLALINCVQDKLSNSEKEEN